MKKFVVFLIALKNYVWEILLWIDQGVNVIFAPLLNWALDPQNGRFGCADETLSSVFGKNMDNCKACGWICAALRLIDKDHCIDSIENVECNQPHDQNNK